MSDYVFGENVSDEYPKVFMSIERITPDVAEEMLKHNTHNRKLSGNIDAGRGTVYNSMLRGQWRLNGETIVFSYDGVLRDGQHRLASCVKSGKPFTTLVVRGIEPDAQETMDTGRSRSVSDVLAMDGINNSQTVASVTIVLLNFATSGYDGAFLSNSISKTTRTEQISFAREHADGINDALRVAHFHSDGTRLFAPSVLTSLAYLFTMVSEEDARFFFDDLSRPVPSRQPIAMLKMAMANARSEAKGVSISKRVQFAYIIKAWNAYMCGEEIKNLRWRRGGARPEKFPEIYGMTPEIVASIRGDES